MRPESSPGGPPDALSRQVDALAHGAILVDRSSRLRMRFTGPRAAESLNGLVTNDVAALAPGHGQYAAALTPRGKVIADLRIFRRAEDLIVDVTQAAATGWTSTVRKYVNPRFAKYDDVTAETADLAVVGARARALLQAWLGEAAVPDAMPAYAHSEAMVGGASVMVIRVPDYGLDAYEVIGPRETIDAVGAGLAAAGAVASDENVLEPARIAAGRPEWGKDMDESVLAQEVDLDRLGAISFTKGCYTGQETVARVHYRGHVNRHLRGLSFAGASVPPRGAELIGPEGRPVGTVLSAAESPALGSIALALVRREIDPGTTLRVEWDGRSLDATVQALPFGG